MTLQKRSKVVLLWEGEWFWFLRAPTALLIPISILPILSMKMHSTGTVRQPLGDDAASSDTETNVSVGAGPISEAEPVPVVEEVSVGPTLRTHCDGWTQWISLAFFLGEQWS